MTNDQEGRRMVKISFQQLDDLKTKLINAIQVVVDNDLGDIEKTINLKIDNDEYCFFPKVLAEIPESKAALENVNVFKKAWVDQVKKFRPF